MSGICFVAISLIFLADCGFHVRAFGLGDIKLDMGKQVKFERVALCPGTEKKTIMIYTVQKMYAKGNKYISNATVFLKEDINVELVVVLELHRCKTKENPDTCENFHTFRIEHFCEALETQSMFESMKTAVTPRFRCPMKKGRYTIKNMEGDVGFLLILPADGSFYKMKTELRASESNKLFSCNIFEARIVNKRH